jgi:hypothetical protein
VNTHSARRRETGAIRVRPYRTRSIERSNKVSLESDTPDVVDVAAFEMTDTRDDEDEIVIFDNDVGFNDFRGTDLQVVLTPEALGDENVISRNLGDNRGQGAHPSAFKD